MCVTEKDGQLACPLHISFEGKFAAFVWVNGAPIGQYHGDLGVCVFVCFFLL